ncbi:hypothetical protein HanPSC8_Chr17g0750101 [Helianthus annuus]|nr:hypothetical protein HanPSC8_Chr17g0750101 [Helianthus annuus]
MKTNFVLCVLGAPEFDDILPSWTYFENKDPAEQESLISDVHDVTANAASVIDACMLRDAESSAVDGDSLNPQVCLYCYMNM